MRQQNLRGAERVLAKRRFVHLHQAHLADGRRRLQLVNLMRPRFPAQPFHALGDGAGRHQQYFMAIMRQGSNLPYPIGNQRMVNARTVVGDQG